MTPEAIGKLVAEATRPLRQRLSDLESRRDESIDLAKSIGRQEALVEELRRGFDRQPDVKALIDAESARISEACTKAIQEVIEKAEGWREAMKSLEVRHQDEIVALRKEWEDATAKSAEQVTGLSESVSGEAEKREAFEARLKASEDALREQLAERDTKIGVLEKALAESNQKQADAFALIEKTADRIDAAEKAIPQDAAGRLEEVQKESAAALAERDARIAELEKSLASVLETVANVDQSLTAIKALEIPKVPDEVIALPEQFEEVRKQVGDAIERVNKCMRFAGRWDEGETYKVGDTVAEKNSLWVAMVDNPPKGPGSDLSGWQLAIKSGKLVTPYEHR